MLNNLEVRIYGEPQSGGVLPRCAAIEQILSLRTPPTDVRERIWAMERRASEYGW